MSENVPKNWKMVLSVDYCANVTDGTHDSPKPVENNGLYLLTSKNITSGELNYKDAYCISKEDFDKINNRSLVEQYDVLYSMIGTVGESCIVKNSKIDFAIKNVGLFKFNGNELDAKWFNYYLKTDFAKNYTLQALKGSTQKYIPLNVLRKFPIQIPSSTQEQEEIVKVLDAASDMVRLRKQCIQHAQDLIPALFQEMFGAIDDNNYEKVLFGNIITVLTDYHANGSYEKLKEHVTLLDNPDYALMVRTTDLEKNNFRDNVKYINQSAYEFLEKSKIYGGEIIINKIGSAGNVYLMPNLNRPVSLGMNTFLIRIDEKQANNIFIYNLLNSSYGKNIIQEKISGAVTKTITKNSIRGLKLYLPSIEQQELFAQRAIEIENYIKEQQEELKKSEDLFQSLLHHAFTGELTRRAYGN